MRFFECQKQNDIGIFLRTLDKNEEIRFFKTNGQTALSGWSLNKLNERVANGNYKEITIEKANALLEIYGFPKYLIKERAAKIEKIEEIVKLEKIKIGNLD